jgi:hypothetical protein
MRFDARLVAAMLFFAPALSFADPLANRGLEEGAGKGPEVTDAMIDERKRALDRILARRLDDAGKEASENIALENKLKQERIDFEKKQIADRRAFLDDVRKETDPKKRSSMYGKFNTDQQNARRQFINGQNSKREDQNQGFRKSRMIRNDEIAVSMPVAAVPVKPAVKSAPAAKKPAKK